MKLLLVCEYRQGKLMNGVNELIAFADRLGAERAFFLVGSEGSAEHVDGVVYRADAARYGEYNPDVHKHLVVEAANTAQADRIVFLHSANGWDAAPRVASVLGCALISEIVAVTGDAYEVSCFNAKMRRVVKPRTARAVLTLQAGAFNGEGAARAASLGMRTVESIERPDPAAFASRIALTGYEEPQEKELDLARADVIVSAGRGVGKREHIPLIAALAQALHGELGATRPVVDAGWLGYSHQVGSTGQIVSPKLYVACGVSGAIQHLAGMKHSKFIVAINKDRDAPITAVADVLVVADVTQFVPVLTARLRKE